MDYKNPFFLTVLDKGYNSIETAKKMVKSGKISLEDISDFTGLSIEEIQKLVEEKD